MISIRHVLGYRYRVYAQYIYILGIPYQSPILKAYARRMKRFWEWMKLKQKLDKKRDTPPDVFPDQIWWASLGENIGTEIYGKSDFFSRPVIIFKVLSRHSFFVIPVTTRPHTGAGTFLILTKELQLMLVYIKCV